MACELHLLPDPSCCREHGAGRAQAIGRFSSGSGLVNCLYTLLKAGY